MKIVFISFLLSIILTAKSLGQEYDEYLLKANQSYKSGDYATAKTLYLKAADKGSAEAHYVLGCKYNVTKEGCIIHFSEAARKGHEKALGAVLGKLLFRVNSLKRADPQKALDIYYEAKKSNPNLKLSDEANKVRIMKMCVEPKGFDAEIFMEKYGIEDEDGQHPFYDIWELAEEASRIGRFGKPDPELVLNLVIRGAGVLAELESAIEETYSNWKNGVIKEFNICDHITSVIGAAYCKSRAEKNNKKEKDIELDELKEKLGADYEQLLYAAYNSAVKFIESKAWHEEGHGGSGRLEWITNSEVKQKNQYLKLINRIYEGFKPSPENSLTKADKKLNEVYQKVMNRIAGYGLDDRKSLERKIHFAAKPKGLREVQRLWIPYRDASVELFVRINPSIDENIWKSWLTEIRIRELESIR